jgi:hypothetical protein
MTTQPEPVPPSVPPADHLPPGLSPNGHPTPSAQALQAVAGMIGQLPQMLFSAVAQALQSAPVTVRPLRCATCVLEQQQWGHRYAAEIAAAQTALQAAAAGQEAKAPEDRVPLNGLDYLPEKLRPGGPEGPPPLQDAAVMAGGTLLCTEHIPGAPGQPGKRPFLIAQGSLPSGLLSEFLRGQQTA